MLGHFGMIPLINHDSRLRENSEVVIIMVFKKLDSELSNTQLGQSQKL